jgi:hypothetical protein
VYLVGALTGDSGAQENLQRLNAEMDAAARDYSDAADAIEQVSQKLSSLESDLKNAARREQREKICDLIKARIAASRDQRIGKLARQLEEALRERAASDNEIRCALESFDGHLYCEGAKKLGDIWMPSSLILGSRPKSVWSRSDFDLFGSAETLFERTERAPEALASLLKAVESFLLPGDPSCNVYKVLTNIARIDGRSFAAGEIVAMHPDEAAEWGDCLIDLASPDAASFEGNEPVAVAAEAVPVENSAAQSEDFGGGESITAQFRRQSLAD